MKNRVSILELRKLFEKMFNSRQKNEKVSMEKVSIYGKYRKGKYLG